MGQEEVQVEEKEEEQEEVEEDRALEIFYLSMSKDFSGHLCLQIHHRLFMVL